MESTAQWHNLPEELLAMIAQRLESHIDVLRFRSVCISWWRSFIPPSYSISPPSSLKIPFPSPPKSHPSVQIRRDYFTFSQSTIYRLEQIPNPSTSSSSSSSSSRGWLVRVKEEKPNKMRMLSPLADFQIKPLPQNFPKLLNLSHFRISEICKAYSPQCCFLRSNNGFYNREFLPPYINKVAVLPSNAHTDNYAQMAIIYSRGRLGFLKSGDEEWTAIEELPSGCSDVISFKGQFYAVKYNGRAVAVDPFLEVTEIASAICDNGCSRKHLVESFGDLFLVDRSLQEQKQTALQFKVYKLNEEEHNWVEVRSLGDRVLFLGDDCSFSAYARDFAGCKGNCVYYTDQHLTLRGFQACNPGVFDLEDGSLRPLGPCPRYSDIFWPPATWLNLNPCSYLC